MRTKFGFFKREPRWSKEEETDPIKWRHLKTIVGISDGKRVVLWRKAGQKAEQSVAGQAWGGSGAAVSTKVGQPTNLANPGGWPSGPTQVGGQVGQPRPTYVTCAPHSTNAQPDLGRPVGQGTNSFSSFQFFSWFTNWFWTRKSWRSHYNIESWQYGLPKLWWKNWYDGGDNNADEKAMMMMTTRLVAAPCFEIVQPPRSRSAHGGHHPPLQLHHCRHHRCATKNIKSYHTSWGQFPLRSFAAKNYAEQGSRVIPRSLFFFLQR